MPTPAASPLHVRRWPGRDARAAVVLLHGMESHAGWFEAVGEGLAARGLTAVAYDRAGWGRSSGRSGHVASPSAALAELEAVSRSLFEEFDAVHLCGLSWGGLLALYAAVAAPERFSGVTALVPAVFPLRRLTLGARLRVAFGALFGLPRQVALPIAVEDFTAKLEAQAFIRSDEWRRTAVSPAFLLATLAMQAKVVRAGLPRSSKTRILLAETDALIDNAKTESFARRNGVAVQTLPGTRHSLVFECPDGVADEVARHVV